MSTTLDLKVAVGYAGTGVASVLELQMSMLARGADISWLSQAQPHAQAHLLCSPPHPRCVTCSLLSSLLALPQYPLEREILFAPLCALDTIDTRVHSTADGVTLLMVNTRPTVNRSDLTLTQAPAPPQRRTPRTAHY